MFWMAKTRRGTYFEWIGGTDLTTAEAFALLPKFAYLIGANAVGKYADSQRVSLLLAKKDGRLWLILKGLTMFGMPVELRNKIVDFAFFGRDAPDQVNRDIAAIRQRRVHRSTVWLVLHRAGIHENTIHKAIFQQAELF